MLIIEIIQLQLLLLLVFQLLLQRVDVDLQLLLNGYVLPDICFVLDQLLLVLLSLLPGVQRTKAHTFEIHYIIVFDRVGDRLVEVQDLL